MVEPTAHIPKGSWVLVTGVNGFVASHVAREFLRRGYKVRGTVRDVEKSSWLVQDVFKSYTDDGNFELVVVPDLAVENAFDDAVKGVSAVAHVATITSMSPNPHEVIPQAIAGTNSIMHAALKEPSVKTFVFTSSVNAATMYVPGNSTHVTQDTWNDEVVKLAWAPPPYDSSRSMIVYAASKVEAEQAMWKFVAERKPHFRVNSVSPTCIMGEPLNKKHLETPYAYIKSLCDGNVAFLAPMPSFIHIDVKDVALVHVAAALDAEVDNARLQTWADYGNWNDALAIMQKLYPQRSFGAGFPPSTPLSMTADFSQPLALLKKWGHQDGWTPLAETVADNMRNIVAWYP